MITIKNLHNEKPKEEYDVKVDRTSVLGNPYYMNNEKERNKVCESYEDWFYHASHEQTFFEEFDRLKELYKKHGKLNLFCWCAPKRCHAETIKECLEY